MCLLVSSLSEIKRGVRRDCELWQACLYIVLIYNIFMWKCMTEKCATNPLPHLSLYYWLCTVCVCVCMYVYISIYIYRYTEREREREGGFGHVCIAHCIKHMQCMYVCM